jgi:hypothetical protein
MFIANGLMNAKPQMPKMLINWKFHRNCINQNMQRFLRKGQFAAVRNGAAGQV